MKASDLMLGNLVAGIENAFPASTVIALEPGLVHLSSRVNPDDERDIVGVPISKYLIEQIGCLEGSDYIIHFNNHRILFSILQYKFGFILFYRNDKNSPIIELQFFHELQNLLYSFGFKNNEFIKKIEFEHNI